MIGEALKQLRKFHDLTLSQTAEKLGVSVSYLSEIENGVKENISLDLLEKYSQAFDVKKSDILLFSEFRNNSTKDKVNKALKIMKWITDNAGRA